MVEITYSTSTKTLIMTVAIIALLYFIDWSIGVFYPESQKFNYFVRSL